MPHLPFEHYRKTHICRVPPALPSARTRALGKAPLCRVPKAQHSANTRHSARPTFAKCRPSAKKGHSASFIFVECHWACTRQRGRTCPARAPGVRRPLWVADGRYLCRVLQGWHSAKTKFRRVHAAGTRQSQFR